MPLDFAPRVAAPPKADPDRARQLLKEASYDGSPVVLMDPLDVSILHGAMLVSARA